MKVELSIGMVLKLYAMTEREIAHTEGFMKLLEKEKEKEKEQKYTKLLEDEKEELLEIYNVFHKILYTV